MPLHARRIVGVVGPSNAGSLGERLLGLADVDLTVYPVDVRIDPKQRGRLRGWSRGSHALKSSVREPLEYLRDPLVPGHSPLLAGRRR